MTPTLKRACASLIILTTAVLCVWAGYYRGRQMSPPAQFISAGTVAKEPSLPGFALTYSGTGTLDVPAQVAPGTYLIGPSDDGCVWQRLRRDSYSVNAIIATGQLGRGAPPRLVVVERTDRYLRLLSCTLRHVS